MVIEIIDKIDSEYFKKAVQLGDENSKTLGFLPYRAFEKYAVEKKLIGVFEKNSKRLMGYLLYRVSFNKVTIVHCCVNSKYRNKKVALKLVSYLKENTKPYDGIRLSCRNDYGIDRVWESLNFVPVREKRGKSKKGFPLTVWWYPHYQNDLISQISDYEMSNKSVAVIDMNIFLDIKHEREEESLALNSDWLIGEAIIYYSREMLIEINRSQTAEQKKSSRQLLKNYNELPPFRDEKELIKVFKDLEKLISLNSINDKSDLNHIAYSILGGANYFITRDKDILKKSKLILIKYGLNICRPSDFITHLDENIQVSKYKPQRIVGTSINSNNISSSDIELLVDTFLFPLEKKYKFQKIIRDCLAYPMHFELITIKKNEELLAFVVFDNRFKNKIKIPIFRFLKHNLKITLSKHLLFKAIFNSTNEEKTIIEITDEIIDQDIVQTIEESRFIHVGNCWKKINLQGVISEKEIISEIIKIGINKSDVQLILNQINFKSEKKSTKTFIKSYNLERHFSPIKIKELEIPTFIVSIKPQWAEKLFDDKSIEKLPLFESRDELLLNRENVYYRSSSKKILKSPSRILWYISENKSTKCIGRIGAVSYIDEIFIDTPKKLFKQFRNLGVYEWNQIQKTAGGKDELMAFVFSDTELFKKSISLKIVKEIVKDLEEKNFMPLSPIEIKTETYLALYKLGMELE